MTQYFLGLFFGRERELVLLSNVGTTGQQPSPAAGG
jgi:hypothetical protein